MIIKSWLAAHYLFLPLLGGIGIAIVAGPLGSVMIWRRLAYFGDTLAHSSLLGISLAFAWQLHVSVGIALIAVVLALLLWQLQKRPGLASDTLLGLLSHTTLAAGLLVLAFQHEQRIDVLGFLYGDILAISLLDVIIIYIGGALVLGCLAWLWDGILRICVDAELAQVEGIKVQKIQALIVVLLALVIAMAIKMVGALLLGALLIIPPASARYLANSPEKMALLAILFGMIAVLGGMLASYTWDLPTGPAMVMAAALLLAISQLTKYLFYRSQISN